MPSHKYVTAVQNWAFVAVPVSFLTVRLCTYVQETAVNDPKFEQQQLVI